MTVKVTLRELEEQALKLALLDIVREGILLIRRLALDSSSNRGKKIKKVNNRLVLVVSDGLHNLPPIIDGRAGFDELERELAILLTGLLTKNQAYWRRFDVDRFIFAIHKVCKWEEDVVL